LDTKILFRPTKDNHAEMVTAGMHFGISSYRNDPRLRNSLIIGRYSVLPNYEEVYTDLQFSGSQLINSSYMHNYIANFHYYKDIKNITFKSWSLDEFIRANPQGKFVVKGLTNSHKWDWNKRMFAPSYERAIQLALDIRGDAWMAQEPIIRAYEPLKTFEIGLNGLPFTNEYRFFFYRENLLCGGYYWSCADKIPAGIPEAAQSLAIQAAKKLAKKVEFFAVDVAEKEDGSWIVVEVNDAQMAGLSECDPNQLYGRLKECLV
jgi:hypothetical protein